jgi:hypothetical protein
MKVEYIIEMSEEKSKKLVIEAENVGFDDELEFLAFKIDQLLDYPLGSIRIKKNEI